MKFPCFQLFFLKVLLLAIFVAGCQSTPEPTVSIPEKNIQQFEFEGLRLGSSPKDLEVFSQIEHIGLNKDDMRVFEIPNPKRQVSKAVVFFQQDRLKKLELRYFNGPGIRTLERAGGWEGIRDYLVEHFGTPSKQGAGVPLVTTQEGLTSRYAKFNGVWFFPKAGLQLNYIALADTSKGVGVITLTDTKAPPTPVRKAAEPQQAVSPSPTPKPNPGFRLRPGA